MLHINKLNIIDSKKLKIFFAKGKFHAATVYTTKSIGDRRRLAENQYDIVESSDKLAKLTT